MNHLRVFLAGDLSRRQRLHELQDQLQHNLDALHWWNFAQRRTLRASIARVTLMIAENEQCIAESGRE